MIRFAERRGPRNYSNRSATSALQSRPATKTTPSKSRTCRSTVVAGSSQTSWASRLSQSRSFGLVEIPHGTTLDQQLERLQLSSLTYKTPEDIGQPRHAIYPRSAYDFAIPFLAGGRQASNEPIASNLRERKASETEKQSQSDNFPHPSSPLSTSQCSRIHFASTFAACVDRMAVYNTRNIVELLLRNKLPVQRKKSQLNRTIDDTQLAEVSLLVFINRQKLAKEFWDSGDVVEELEQIYPGRLSILRFPSWNGTKPDCLQICFKASTSMQDFGRHGNESFEWFIWQVAERQLK